jgi:predicted lactoylglutathione lyase
MGMEFPAAVPEMPVRNVDEAAAYYASCLGFGLDWGDDAGGIAGISKEDCRIFLTNAAFRTAHGNAAPVLVWINLTSRDEVDELHRVWKGSGAMIISAPESKPWNLYEFTAADLDGNLLRVFYDFGSETRSVSDEVE